MDDAVVGNQRVEQLKSEMYAIEREQEKLVDMSVQADYRVIATVTGIGVHYELNSITQALISRAIERGANRIIVEINRVK